MPARPRVLFVCADPVGAEMAGLGIRNWELARVVAGGAAVTIAHGGAESGVRDGVVLVPYRPHDPRAVVERLADADVVVTAPGWPPLMRALRRSRARVVLDLYDPETLETLELSAARRALPRRGLVTTTLDRLHDALRTGHHFMCASDAQRDLWLGAMLALRMITPDAYDRDRSYLSVIDLVPFGIPEQPPPSVSDGRVRARLGLARDAELVLWNGGLWQWLDAPTAVRAIATLRERRPDAVLVFMGGAADHPAARAAAAQARALARELGLLGTGVVFHDAWVAYEQRADWLQTADVAVAAAHDHLETRFAYRTRLLDCLWAGLPIACTSGDALAERVAREGLGAVAAPGDVAGLATAIESILERGRASFAPALAAAAETARWSTAATPLLEWVARSAAGEPPPSRARRGAIGRPTGARLRDVAYSVLVRRLLARRR